MDNIEIDSLILFSSIMLNISLKIALNSPVDLKIVRFVFCTYWENSLLSESLSITQFGHSQSWFGRLIPKSIIKNNIFDEVRTGFPMACSCHGFVTVICSDVSVVNLFSALSAEKSTDPFETNPISSPSFLWNGRRHDWLLFASQYAQSLMPSNSAKSASSPGYNPLLNPRQTTSPLGYRLF